MLEGSGNGLVVGCRLTSSAVLELNTWAFVGEGDGNPVGIASMKHVSGWVPLR